MMDVGLASPSLATNTARGDQSAMASRPLQAVHWHEGMFLRPHHFQIAEQYSASLAHIRETFDQHHYWGLRSIDLDLDALANYRLVVKSLKARMRDGTLINVPEDGALSDIDLRPSLESAREAPLVTVYLGLPLFQPGQANVSR